MKGRLNFWFWLAMLNLAFIICGNDSVQVTVAFWSCMVLSEIAADRGAE